jgi:hypothetical protein
MENPASLPCRHERAIGLIWFAGSGCYLGDSAAERYDYSNHQQVGGRRGHIHSLVLQGSPHVWHGDDATKRQNRRNDASIQRKIATHGTSTKEHINDTGLI